MPDEGSCSQHSCLHRGWSVCRLGVFHDDGWLSFGPVLDSTVIGCFVNPILGAVAAQLLAVGRIPMFLATARRTYPVFRVGLSDVCWCCMADFLDGEPTGTQDDVYVARCMFPS